jgi:hypothetical protein
VKSSSDAQRPARTLDDGTVTSGKYKKPQSRALDDTVKSGGDAQRPGRAVDDGVVKTSKAKKPHARALDDSKVKSQGASDKADRALDKPAK